MRNYRIKDELLSEEFMRSSGPGGQNVNKNETKVRARYRFGADADLTDAEKNRVRRRARPSELVDADTIETVEQGTPNRERNRGVARQRLQQRMETLIKPEKKRRKTKPSKGANERRLQQKKERGQIKKQRRKPRDW